MKKVVISLLVIGVLVTGVYGSSEKSTELKLGGEAIFPGQDDDWDKGYGASARVIFWRTSELGLALSIGVQKWDVNDEMYTYSEYLGSGIGYGYAGGLEGDATMVPVGASGLYIIPVGKNASLTLEGGLRYVIMNSNVKYVEAEALADTYGNVLGASYSYDVDFDNGIVGIIGADFDIELSPGFRLFAGAGYQIDLLKGDTEADGVDIDYENELKGAFIRAGLAWDL
ncbi:MAG TPA: hypothetical protein PKM67_02385 [Kiritimatiellia bacterium]|nr:hypothetical protein [Kiritimatiellia bacterium]HNS80291.1 hypothetical protein [Kiritimatiellia bacterium]